MREQLDRSTGEATLGVGLERALPDSIDAQILRCRLTAKLFGAEIPPPQVGRFELRDRIGQGGMGVVYRAWDPQLRREVAVKLVDTSDGGDELRERAAAEARGLAQLVHPNVVSVFESGHLGRHVWIAMELVQGTTMQDWLARTPRPAEEAILANWTAIGRGLQAAHLVGLVHRDVKPSNVLIGDDGWPRLIDFGLVHGGAVPAGAAEARMARRAEATGATSEPRRDDTTHFVGTYRYAAPEQRRCERVDARADQYALCMCIWESLCGALPPDVPADRRLDRRLRAVLQRGLADVPDGRFASMAELLDAIQSVGSDRRRARGRGFVVGGGIAVLVGTVVLRSLPGATSAVAQCERDPQAIAGTWDDASREALRRGFSAMPGAYAEASAATVESGIDDWAARWIDARQAACRATRIDATQTEAMLALRLGCLERRRRTLHVTLRTWSSADASRSLSTHAEALLGRLPDLDDCSDPAGLEDAEALPAPGASRDVVLAGYDRLHEARAWISVGELDRAEAIAAALTSNAEVVAHAPLRLESEALRSQLDVTRGKIFAAVPRLIALAQEAETHRLDVLAAELRVDAAEAAAGRWEGGSAEASVVDEAETAVRRLARAKEPLRARLLHARAAVRLQQGDFAAALEGFRGAEAEAIALVQPERAERECWFIAATLGRLGRHAEARARLEEGRAQAEQRWGPGAPLVGAFEFDLGVLALETGDLGAVDRHLDEAGAIARDAFGPDSFWGARVDYARAKARLAEGAFADALTLVDRSYAAHERELGSDHELLAELHEARGVLRFFTGDLPGSLVSYRAALTIARGTMGRDHPSVARLLSNLGESQMALGRLTEADESFEQALELYARTLPADHPEVALPLKGRGQIALATGQAARAVEDLERALVLQQTTGAEPLEIADIQFSLAKALVAADRTRRSDARALAVAARDAFAAVNLDDRARTVEAWLRG